MPYRQPAQFCSRWLLVVTGFQICFDWFTIACWLKNEPVDSACFVHAWGCFRKSANGVNFANQPTPSKLRPSPPLGSANGIVFANAIVGILSQSHPLMGCFRKQGKFPIWRRSWGWFSQIRHCAVLRLPCQTSEKVYVYDSAGKLGGVQQVSIRLLPPRPTFSARLELQVIESERNRSVPWHNAPGFGHAPTPK